MLCINNVVIYWFLLDKKINMVVWKKDGFLDWKYYELVEIIVFFELVK